MIRSFYIHSKLSIQGRLGGNGVWECAKRCMGNPLMSLDECIRACYHGHRGQGGKSSGTSDHMGQLSWRNSIQDGQTGMGENWN